MPYKDIEKKRAFWRERYYANHQQHRARRKEQYDRAQQMINEFLGGKCAGCGGFHNLEVHHKDRADKKFNPRAFLATWDRLVEELKKCELRCDSCHKVEHAAQHGSLTMYISHKCRCELCREAQRAYRKQRRLDGKR
jgi:hypothetical protein